MNSVLNESPKRSLSKCYQLQRHKNRNLVPIDMIAIESSLRLKKNEISLNGTQSITQKMNRYFSNED